MTNPGGPAEREERERLAVWSERMAQAAHQRAHTETAENHEAIAVLLRGETRNDAAQKARENVMLPCPFCGGEASISDNAPSPGGATFYRAFCFTPGCSGNDSSFEFMISARDAWNRRAALPQEQKALPDRTTARRIVNAVFSRRRQLDHTEEWFVNSERLAEDTRRAAEAHYNEVWAEAEDAVLALLSGQPVVSSSGSGGMPDLSKVTRFEVIDHRAGAQPFGRVYSEWGVAVSLSYQDGGRTLKVFVDDPAEVSGE